jgi:hypothetical protein
MAELSAGLGAFLKRQDSMFAEVLDTQREISRSLMVAERMVGDNLTVQRGGAGLPPGAPPGIQGRRQTIQDFAPPVAETYVNQAIPSGMRYTRPPVAETYVNPALVDPSHLDFDTGGRRALTDFGIDPTKGNLAAQSRSGLKAGVYASLAGRANDYRSEMILDGGYILNPVTGGYMGPDGNEVSASEAAFASSSPETARKLAMATSATRVAQAWSNGAPIGRSLMSAAPAGLLKGAGIAGLAITAGNQALDFYQGEVAQLNQNRGIYGDISVGESYGMRADEWINKNLRGRFSSLGAGAYDQLFQSGSQLALKGGALDEYIDTGADIMSTGASGAQTNQIMKTVIEAGSSLAGLADSIRMVNDAAKDAGVNAGRARDVFIANYEASSDVMFGASGAIRSRTAASLTSAQVSQGREFQSVSYGGAFTDPMQNRMTAASAGISNTEMLSLRQSNPGGAAMLDEARQLETLNRIPTANGQTVQQLVDEWIASQGGYYDPATMQDALGIHLLDVGGIDPVVAQQFLSAVGIRADQGQALGVLGNMFTTASATQQVQRDSAAAREAFTPTRLSLEANTRGGEGMALAPGVLPLSGLVGAYAAGLNGGVDFARHVDGGYEEFKDLVNSGVTNSPAAEYLIHNRGEMGLSGDKTMVRVKDGDSFKVVTLEEAFRYYLDQITDGTAIIVDGASEDFMNMPIGRSIGMPSDIPAQQSFGELIGGSSGSSSYAPGVSLPRASESVGVPFEEWAKARQEENKSDSGSSGGDGKVTIGLTPEAQRILQVMDANDPYMISAPGRPSGAEN